LLVEVRNVVSEAAVAGVPHPLGIAGPKTGPTFAARDQPVDTFKVELIHWTQERLSADEANSGRNLPQEVSAPCILIRFDGNASPYVCGPRQSIGQPCEALRAFSEYLINVPVRVFHSREHRSDELLWHVRMEQVGHRVDENPAGPLPLQREFEPGLPEAQVKALLVVVAGNAPEALGKRQCITVVATR
jgi:hypothetical protein